MRLVWLFAVLVPLVGAWGIRQRQGTLGSPHPHQLQGQRIRNLPGARRIESRFLHPKQPAHRHRRSLGRGCFNWTKTLTTNLQLEVGYLDYQNNANCVWTITTPNTTDRIVLVSEDFLLEDSYNCRYDYVEVFDRKLEPTSSIGKFCGRSRVLLISRSRRLKIHFKTDSSVVATGFRFYMSRLQADSESPCNRTYEGTSGTVSSPNYSLGTYPHNLTCLYSFKAPRNQKVKIDFNDFVLERGPCVDDYLAVYDGMSSASAEIGSFCGRRYPRSITSSGDSLFLLLHTNWVVSDKGFNISYSFVDDDSSGYSVVDGGTPPEYDPDCSTVITDPGLTVISPHSSGQDFYQQKKKCRTIIRPPQGQGVALYFRKIDMEDSLDCIYDHVNVTYHLKEGGTTTTRLCGYHRRKRRCFHSWDGDITLDFTSDVLFESFGYKATYSFILPNETSNVACEYSTCEYGCQGYCYNNGKGFHCACPTGKVPPECIQNITWQEPLGKKLTMYEGTTIKLQCGVNHPHTITVWDFNDFMLPDETKNHIIVDGSTLEIRGVQAQDEGNYTCTVQAGDWLQSQTLKLTVKPENDYCGKAAEAIYNPNSNAAIATIAGTNASKTPEAISWQVFLWDKSKESHHCGGVLISDRHVLTAAHCVKGHKAADFNHNNIRVSIGTKSCTHADAEERNIARYMIHPEHNNATLQYDFALLELDRPVRNASRQICPVCLPRSPDVWNNIPATGYRGIISGCGKDSKKQKVPDEVHMTNAPIVARSICSNNNTHFTQDMFCAGYEKAGIGDACAGDSGGGFVAKIKGRWTLLGLISFGRACAQGGEYGYYANVSKALSWIDEVAPVCGKTRFIKGNYQRGKILYGQTALPKQFPWQAAVMMKSSPTCGATIIGARWALTARHCVRLREVSEYQIKRDMKVVVGDIAPLDPDGAHSQGITLKIEKIFTDDSGPDIALLKLKPGIDHFNEHVQPACLPAVDEQIADDETAWLAGWGGSDPYGTTGSLKLLYAEMKMVKHTVCKKTWNNLKDNEICFTGNYNSSIQGWTGDSGSGVVWKYKGRYILSGVYRGGGIKLAGIFSDVKDRLLWIKNKMGWEEDKV